MLFALHQLLRFRNLSSRSLGASTSVSPCLLISRSSADAFKPFEALVEMLLETLGCGADSVWHTEPSVSVPWCLEWAEFALFLIKLHLKKPVL